MARRQLGVPEPRNRIFPWRAANCFTQLEQWRGKTAKIVLALIHHTLHIHLCQHDTILFEINVFKLIRFYHNIRSKGTPSGEPLKGLLGGIWDNATT